MAVKKIDAMQTAQIEALQTDVYELRTKLNKTVTDAKAISVILNQLIDDLNDKNEVMMAGYTSPGSPKSYGVQEALDIFQNGLDEHLNTQTGRYGYLWPGFATHAENPTFHNLSLVVIHPYYGYGLTAFVFGYNPTGFFAPGAGGGSGQAGNSGTTSGSIPGALGGTDQSGNTAHSADSENANVTGQYDNRERLMEVPDATRALRLVRNILNKIRKK